MQTYLEKHQLEQTVNGIVNKVLKERPEDPIETIAQMLQQVAPPSYPSFEKFSARRVYLTENTSICSLKILVYLSYQGQTRMAHTHYFSYDEEERGHFIFDNQEARTGLQKSAQIITNDFTKCLRAQLGSEGLDVENLMRMD